ncbi:MAG TPA: hypothetical protein VK772_07775 [Puia sp.]|jgi:hypothetical protein|nr:hypothetical protein [Puia sp.]
MKLKFFFAKTIAVFLFSISIQTIRCQSLGDEIEKVYDFSPQLLTSDQQNEKIKPLDGFWDKVKSDTAVYLPALRLELASDNHKPYFYFDGSSLLLSLSNSTSDKALAGEAISKCDIKDINNELYVRRLNGLAFDNVDITKAAIKILDIPNYSFFLTQHVMTFSREECLAYCLLPLDSRLYVDTLLEMFYAQDSLGQETILYTLWLGYTCKGDQFIRSVMTNPRLSQSVRAGAIEIDSINRASLPAVKQLASEGTNEIMKVRTEALKRFSDEALNDLFISNMAIRKKMQCDFVPRDKDVREKRASDQHDFAKSILALNEFKIEDKRVDSLNKTSDHKRRITITIIDDSYLKEDNPKIIKLGLVNEENGVDKKILLTIKYDKIKQEIVSVEKN